jgi:hypothetical protein
MEHGDLPVTKQPKIIVIAEFFNLFLVVCHLESKFELLIGKLERPSVVFGTVEARGKN